MAFAVDLSAESDVSVTVDWATSAGTATPGPGRDYTEASGTVTFLPGQTSRTIHVAVRDDRVREDDETLTVTLSAPSNATLAAEDATATGVIVDNDGFPRLLVAGASAAESEGELMFAVTLQGRTAQPVTVEWTTSAGTATPDVDYVEANGTLVLGPAAIGGKIAVSLLDDTLREQSETFKLILSRPTNARINGRTISATGTIQDDDRAAAPPPEVQVADASAVESDGALLFTVTLDRAGRLPATVRWATSAGTATPGVDYVEGNGVLTFAPGETLMEVAVALLDDLLHEEAETLRLSLIAPTNATIEVWQATGTIRDDENPDVAEAWLARFSRTAASHALEAVEDRIRGGSGLGSHITLAGRRLNLSGRGESRTAPGASWGILGSDTAASSDYFAATSTGGTLGQMQGNFGSLPGNGRYPQSTGFGARDPAGGRSLGYGASGLSLSSLLQRSSFQFSGFLNEEATGDADAGGAARDGWSIWGRGATTRFGGGESNLSVGGDVATGTVGIDFERGRILFGVASSHSYGEGDVLEYGRGGGVTKQSAMESSLTTGLPYLRFAVSDRFSLWGILGHGQGTMTLSQEGLGSIETDIAMDMGALGFRHELRQSGSACGCLDLALKSDVLLLNATADESIALPSLSRDVSRVRLMMEGSRTRKLDSGALLVPSAELGLRYDGGDAETGSGMEFGAGIRYANAPRGLLMELRGRSLLTHQSGELTEWGLAGAIRVDPGGATEGLSFGLRSTWGSAMSGLSRLWEQQQGALTRGYDPTDMKTVAEADVGYRLNLFGGRARLMPYMGAGMSDHSGQAYRLGTRVRVWESLHLDLEGAHRDSAGHLPSGFVLGLRGSFVW